MRAVKIDAQSNGAHRNQDGMSVLSDGWAVIPAGMELPNFPFGDVVAEEIDGVMTVTSWIPGTMPEPKPEPEPSTTLEDRVSALEAEAEQAALDRAALTLLLTGEDTEVTT